MPASFTQRTCPVCDAYASDEFLRKSELRLVRCRHCAMVYANPVETSLVSGAFYDDLVPGFYLDPDKLAADYASVRFARELKIFRRFCSRGPLLDVGCSNGAFLHRVQERFPNDYETLGVDVAGSALDYAASRGLPVRKGSFLEMDFGAQKFSAITFWATLEHLVDPARYLVKAATLLAPGGHCFILVPNFKSLAVRLLGPKYRYILPQHVNYFDAASLQKLARREPSVSVAYLSSTHFNPVVIWQDRRVRPAVTDADRIQLLKRTTALKQNPVLKPARLFVSFAETLLGAAFLADNLVLVLRKS